MPRSLRPFRSDFPRALPALVIAALGFSGPAPGSEPAPPPAFPGGVLTVAERSVSQEQGGWLVTYRLRYQGAASLVVSPADVLLKLDGWVSNSRVASHAVPRPSSLTVSTGSNLTATADVITAADESQRCRERVTVQVWDDDPSADAPPPPLPVSPPSTRAASAPAVERAPVVTLAPGATVRARVKIDHLHFIYGDYDPLLGNRALELQLAGAVLRDTLPLDHERYVAQAKNTWPAPPEDRRDPTHFVSAPDSLHLEAHVPGNQYYRFPERPVRYGTRMRLRYTYFIAGGTEGECRVRMAQYKDTPTTYKVLSDGAYEQGLTTVGRWVKVERVFRTEADATTIALDFRIVTSGVDVGEMWVDDVSLEPVECPGQAGP